MEKDFRDTMESWKGGPFQMFARPEVKQIVALAASKRSQVNFARMRRVFIRHKVRDFDPEKNIDLTKDCLSETRPGEIMNQKKPFSTKILNSLILSLFLAGHSSFGGVPLLDESRIQEILKSRIDIGEKNVGIVLGIIDDQGRKIISHGFFDKTRKRPVDGKTLFEIGSITKVFTALLLACMVDRGEIGLHDPLGKFLPTEMPGLKRAGKEISLLHLANHTSGLPRIPDNMDSDDVTNPYARYGLENLYAFLASYTLSCDIGSQYQYSNLGAGLLGTILSEKGRVSYEKLILTRISTPLGMGDTSISLSAEQLKRFATGHDEGGEPVNPWDFNALAGCGALRSTADDMLTFLAHHIGLATSTIDSAIQETQKHWRKTDDPDLQIGLGWHLWTKFQNRIVWHNGGTHGFHSFAGFDADRKLGVVVLSNSSHSIDDIGLHILNTAFPLAEVKPPPKVVEVPSQILSDYSGEYELTPEVIFSITTKDGRLYAQLTGQPELQVFPESETKFFYKVVDAQLTFFRNMRGEVTHLVLHQFGQDQRADRRSQPGVSLPQQEERQLGPELLKRLVGKYELQPGVEFTVTQTDKHLMVHLTGQPSCQVYAKSETRFFYKIIKAEIEFKVGQDGKVEGLTLFQMGRELFAPRKN